MNAAIALVEMVDYSRLSLSELKALRLRLKARTLVSPYLKTLGLPLNWHEDGVCVALPKLFNPARIDLLRSRFEAVLLMEIV